MALEVYDINANDMSTKLSTEYNSGIRKLLSTGYKQEKCLMVGDAPGDCKAAEENGIFFYPILVNQEQSSWEQLVLEALDRLEDGIPSIRHAPHPVAVNVQLVGVAWLSFYRKGDEVQIISRSR